MIISSSNGNLPPAAEPVVIRLASAADAPAVEVLAQLDSRRVPRGDVLIGERHGRPIAAVALTSGESVADPFIRTAEVVELLQIRARQLRAA
jgi:hypothetical protein